MDDLKNKIDLYRKTFDEAVELVQDFSSLQELHNLYLGRKKGIISELLEERKSVGSEEMPEVGRCINDLKVYIRDRLEGLKQDLSEKKSRLEWMDMTLPGKQSYWGAPHPIRRLARKLSGIFYQLGFVQEIGPEIETDFNNFDALNCSPEHLYSDSWRPLYISENKLLRTHLLPAQIRVLKKKKPPVRVISSGKVYDGKGNAPGGGMMSFHMTGLLIDHQINFADMKGVVEFFLKSLFSEKVKIRFRPGYAPFAVPAAVAEIGCPICQNSAASCWGCGETRWVRAAEAGMIDPQVLKNVNIDPEKFSGFFFGLDVDSLSAYFYRVPDTRSFYENDLRFIRQFTRS